MSTVLSQTTPKARKEYQCYLCARPICVGEQHDKMAGETDGDFWSMRMHHKCADLTRGWDEDNWECHDPHEFRRYEFRLKGERL